jgi:hypothetical protein
MTHTELKEKVLQGGKQAIQKLIEKKRKENGFLVISQHGKVIRIPAKDIKP